MRVKAFTIHKKIFFLLLIFSMLIMLAGSGCASRSGDMYEVAPMASSDEATGSERDFGMEEAPTEPAVPSPNQYSIADGTGIIDGDVPSIGHKIIQTGEILLETLDFEESVENLQRYVQGIGGYAESSYVEGRRLTESSRPTRRTAVFTFRIPQQRFSSFADSLKEYGNVLSSSTHGENITDRYFDTEARLKSLQVQDERMLSLLEKADTIEDIMRIESELTNLRYQIESLTGTLQKWDNLVQFATYRVEVREVDQVTPDPAEASWFNDIAEAFKDSVIAVINTLQNLVIYLIMAIPFLVVGVPLLLIVRKVFHVFRDKRVKGSNPDDRLK